MSFSDNSSDDINKYIKYTCAVIIILCMIFDTNEQ